MKPIKSMRELELMKQNLNYKVLHLEDKLKGRSKDTISAVTYELKEIAFETGMKLILNLFFKNKKEQTKT